MGSCRQKSYISFSFCARGLSFTLAREAVVIWKIRKHHESGRIPSRLFATSPPLYISLLLFLHLPNHFFPPPALVLLLIPLSPFLQKVRNKVYGEGEYDGRVLLGGDRVQGLENQKRAALVRSQGRISNPIPPKNRNTKDRLPFFFL